VTEVSCVNSKNPFNSNEKRANKFLKNAVKHITVAPEPKRGIS